MATASTSASSNAFSCLNLGSIMPLEWKGFRKISEVNSSPFDVFGDLKLVFSEPFGRVIDADINLGFSAFAGGFGFGLSAVNNSFKIGKADSLIRGSFVSNSIPSLKATLMNQVSQNACVALSYDLSQNNPGLSAYVTGEAGLRKSFILVQTEPRYKSMKVSAAVSTPGLEWRRPVYDVVDGTLEFPEDDGARHFFWLQNETNGSDLMIRTSLGCRLDVGRVANVALNFLNKNLTCIIPQNIVMKLLPQRNSEQRYVNLSNWDFYMGHKLQSRSPTLALSKKFGPNSLHLSYDLNEDEAGVHYSFHSLTVGAKIQGGSEGLKPSAYLSISPLSFL